MASSVETLIRKTVTKGVVKLAQYNNSRLKAPAEPHPFLSGIHAPMADELTLDTLSVTGTIPTELDGRYIRIGPNPITPPNPASYHWFTGDGMVHGVRLQGGKALWYRNRWIRSNAVSAALGDVLGHAGETWGLVEAGGNPVRFDEELNTIAHDPFGSTLKGSFTAHPHLDPLTGEMHAICYDATQHDRIRHVVVGANGKVRREEVIKVEHGPSIHDCMITKNYVIILDLPVTFSMKRMIQGYPFPYAWNPDHQARVGLLPREGSGEDVIWCDVDPAYVFHPCNGYERNDGTVILDVCAHNTMFTQSTQGPDSARVPFERWTIDPVGKNVVRAVIDADSQEFPRPNEARLGQSYRYAYAVALPDGFDAAAPNQHMLYKHDLVTGTRAVHDFGKGNIPSEFVFVAKAGATAEDNGWMMGYVVNSAADTTDLVILDAANFVAEPVARVHIPHRIPSGFHGNWVAA
jgi:8'-apo-carotenoid 13,14-cleaving dioxygenase